ncbi:cilia- and flagella-associated protein 69-like [Brachionichthys hirsutus]|uniref:cilia- and flagella-associated protein 69-like n=1 Tax=Brachionichthys hirsutus TaxID=412623 RepID=UPI00360521A2
MDSGKFTQSRKLDFPLIRPGAPKDDQRIHQANTKSLALSKVVSLLKHPLTANLKQRHLFVLRKLLQKKQTGFLLKELADLAQILNICAEKVTDDPEYAPILCEALWICGRPFLKEKASDELNYAQDVTEFLSYMGCLMKVPDAEVRRQLVESVKSFYSVAPKQLLDGLQPTSPGYRLQLLERSDLAHTLLLSMAAMEHQSAIRLQLLQTLQILSSSSDLNCASMLYARGAETICLHMNEPDPSGQLLLSSCEILWNLLERGNKEEVAAQLGSLECVTSLKEAFLQQLLNGSQQGDLRLTNDLLMITTLIAENVNSHLIESLFGRQLVVLATFPELKSNNPLVENLNPTFTREDFKRKKLLLNLLVCMSKDVASLQLYKEEKVVLSLLMLTKPPAALSEQRSGSRRWSSTQQEELQLQALATLATIAPLMLDDYMSCQGNTCLLILLDWCVRHDAVFGQGLQGAAGSKQVQMQHCIRALRSVTSSGINAVNQDLCDQGIINQLLGILKQMEAGPDKDDVITLEIKSDIQSTLSVLCESDMHRKELFGSEGVEMAVHFLRKGCSNFYSGLGHNKLILTTVDSVWSCIAGCYTTEDYFLVKRGVCLLLDLLSSSPRCLHGHVLATLLELCNNPNTQSHILSWKGDVGQTAPGLLLQLWREEEEDLKVSRTRHGGIADPQRPILGVYQQEDTKHSFPANMPSAAVLEISENLRAKIYFIFCKLGFQDLPGLSAKHHVTLNIIRRYLDFKVGEVWGEIRRELTLDGVRPISPDEEALSAICGITEDTARRVAAEQSSIVEQQEKEEAREEERLYSEIKSRLKQQHLAAKSWDSYVSKTSNYEILKEARAQRARSLEPSTSKPEHFVGHVMSVEATDAQGPAGVKVKLARTAIQGAGRDGLTAATEPEQLCARQVAGEVRMQPQSGFINPIAMTMATVGMGMSLYSARQMAEVVHLQQTSG